MVKLSKASEPGQGILRSDNATQSVFVTVDDYNKLD